MNLFKVKYDGWVVVADESSDAENVNRENIRAAIEDVNGGEYSNWDSVMPVNSLAELPSGWEGDYIPYCEGYLGNETIESIISDKENNDLLLYLNEEGCGELDDHTKECIKRYFDEGLGKDYADTHWGANSIKYEEEDDGFRL